MFVLIINLYLEKSKARQLEYIECLEKNLKNPSIERIVIFYETTDQKNQDIFLKKLQSYERVAIVFWAKRPTFGDIFSYANKRLIDKNIILANADIYYDLESGLNLLHNIDLSHFILVLTRYNKQDQIKDYLMKNPHRMGVIMKTKQNGQLVSQINGKSIDSWIFKAPIQPDFKTNYRLGIYGDDSYFNTQLLRSMRYEVHNPCLDVISIHNHNKWDPSKYAEVLDETNKKISCDKWMQKNLANGNYIADIPFCRLAYVKSRQ